MKPRRIQLKRAKGWRKPKDTVVVSRPSKWGNPFKDGTHGSRASYFKVGLILARNGIDFERYSPRFKKVEAHFRRIVCDIGELRGKNLACWCPRNQSCHADVLIDYANK